ncbi:hypothetical protein ACJX0J_035707, partial [Zea mays]
SISVVYRWISTAKENQQHDPIMAKTHFRNSISFFTIYMGLWIHGAIMWLGRSQGLRDVPVNFFVDHHISHFMMSATLWKLNSVMTLYKVVTNIFQSLILITSKASFVSEVSCNLATHFHFRRQKKGMPLDIPGPSCAILPIFVKSLVSSALIYMQFIGISEFQSDLPEEVAVRLKKTICVYNIITSNTLTKIIALSSDK